MTSKAEGSGLAEAISAALLDHGVPVGSFVDVTGGPTGGLVFTVGGTAEDEE